jgi:hypothetical protein
VAQRPQCVLPPASLPPRPHPFCSPLEQRRRNLPLIYNGLVDWLVPGDKPHLCNACGTRYLRKGSLNHSANRRSGPAHLKGRTAPAAAALAV